SKNTTFQLPASVALKVRYFGERHRGELSPLAAGGAGEPKHTTRDRGPGAPTTVIGSAPETRRWSGRPNAEQRPIAEVRGVRSFAANEAADATSRNTCALSHLP